MIYTYIYIIHNYIVILKDNYINQYCIYMFDIGNFYSKRIFCFNSIQSYTHRYTSIMVARLFSHDHFHGRLIADNVIFDNTI